MKQDLEPQSPPGGEKPEEAEVKSAGIQNPGDQDVGPQRKARPRERRRRNGVFLNRDESDENALRWGGFRVPRKGTANKSPQDPKEGRRAQCMTWNETRGWKLGGTGQKTPPRGGLGVSL